MFVGGNYVIFSGNSLIKLSRLLRKFNLRDPLFILQFAKEIVVLLSHAYSVVAHVDGLYEAKAVYSKSSLLWDIFIFTIQFSFDPGLRIAYRNVFSGGGIFSHQAFLARAVQLGLPDHILGLFMIPFSFLKNGVARMRLSKSLITRCPISSFAKLPLLTEKTKIIFSQVKKIKLEKFSPVLAKNLNNDVSFVLKKKIH